MKPRLTVVPRVVVANMGINLNKVLLHRAKIALRVGGHLQKDWVRLLELDVLRATQASTTH